MMTLDDAIIHCLEKVEELKKDANRFAYPNESGTTKESVDCLECANNHRLLADWLIELQFRRTPCATCEEFDDCKNCAYYKKCHKGIIDEGVVSEWIEDISAKREKYKGNDNVAD